jgi:hypothetical protein
MFIISLTFFIAAVSFASFLFFFSKNEIQGGVLMSVTGPNSVESGEPLEFFVSLENNTEFDYQNIEFSITYPKSSIDDVDKLFINHKDVKYPDGLLSGGKIKQRFGVILSGIEEEYKEIKIDVSYKIKGYSNLLFLTKAYNIKIDSSPVNIKVTYPDSVLSKDSFALNLEVMSNSSETLKDLIVVAKYPISFVATETIPKTIFSNTNQGISRIEKIKPGAVEHIKIIGSISGQNKDEKYFTFMAGDAIPFRNEIRTLFAKNENVISIKKSDIGLAVTSAFDNSLGETIVSPDEKIKFSMNLSNNLSSIISDLKINLFVPDNIIDKQKV